MASKRKLIHSPLADKIRSLSAVSAGFGAYFTTIVLVYELNALLVHYVPPKPNQWVDMSVFIGLPLGMAVGAVVSSYVTARIARHFEFLYTAFLILLLVAVWLGHVQSVPGIPDQEPFAVFIYVLPICLPLFALGAWLARLQRRRAEKAASVKGGFQ